MSTGKPYAMPKPSAGSDPVQPIREARRDRPFVVAQLGQSLDGRIATLSGESRWINAGGALDHVHRIRATVDAVMVGVGTVVADDPLLNVRRVEGRHPVRVVIDPTGRVPAHARCLEAADGIRRIVVCATGVAAPTNLPRGVELIRVAADGRTLSPQGILAALWQAGLKSFLVEGGARTVSGFVDAGAVDRLHIMVAPVILGSGKPGLTLRPIDRLAEALRPKAAVHVLAGGDVLFDCDMRHQTGDG